MLPGGFPEPIPPEAVGSLLAKGLPEVVDKAVEEARATKKTGDDLVEEVMDQLNVRDPRHRTASYNDTF